MVDALVIRGPNMLELLIFVFTPLRAVFMRVWMASETLVKAPDSLLVDAAARALAASSVFCTVRVFSVARVTCSWALATACFWAACLRVRVASFSSAAITLESVMSPLVFFTISSSFWRATLICPMMSFSRRCAWLSFSWAVRSAVLAFWNSFFARRTAFRISSVAVLPRPLLEVPNERLNPEPKSLPELLASFSTVFRTPLKVGNTANLASPA